MECERGKAEQEIEIREKTCQLVRSFPAESEYKSRQAAETVHWTWTPFSSTLRGDARKCPLAAESREHLQGRQEDECD